jgi:hypothetical protein
VGARRCGGVGTWLSNAAIRRNCACGAEVLRAAHYLPSSEDIWDELLKVMGKTVVLTMADRNVMAIYQIVCSDSNSMRSVSFVASKEKSDSLLDMELRADSTR